MFKLTPYALMDSSFWFDAIHLGWSIISTEGSQVMVSKRKCISFVEDYFVIANSVDPAEMPQYAAFHLSLHCLPKTLGGTLIFSSYVGSGPASTVHPKKSEISSTPKNI